MEQCQEHPNLHMNIHYLSDSNRMDPGEAQQIKWCSCDLYFDGGGEKSISIEWLTSEVDLESSFWQANSRKTEQWPNFEETPKLKDKLR